MGQAPRQDSRGLPMAPEQLLRLLDDQRVHQALRQNFSVLPRAPEQLQLSPFEDVSGEDGS